MFFRKDKKCDLCNDKLSIKPFMLEVNTADGPIKYTLCKDCSDTIEQLYQLKEYYGKV